MSYDISFKAKIEGLNRYVDVGNCYANTTWNVREMICKSTGLEWKNCDNNGLCRDVIPCIEKGLHELERHPLKYKQYEAPNGWGTVESTKGFFRRIIEDWHNLLEEDEELANVATFWIE